MSSNDNPLSGQALVQYSILALLLPLEIFLFVKLRFQIDPSGIITLLIYLLVAIMRVIEQAFFLTPNLNLIDFIFIVFSQILVWFAVYYFTMEMKVILVELKRGKEHKKIRAKRVQKWLIGFVMLGYLPIMLTFTVINTI